MSQQFICIKPGSITNNVPVSVSLPHPKTGTPARYLIQDNILFEAQKIDSTTRRSWFVNNTVQQDGSIYIFSPIDPIFVIIPVLEMARSRMSSPEGYFVPFDSLFDSDEYPSLPRLENLSGLELLLRHICDVKDESGTIVYRLCDDKVMRWLRAKVDLVSSRFDDVNALKQLLSSSLLDADTLDPENRKSFQIRTAIQIISEYLPSRWINRLLNTYDFSKLEELEKKTEIYEAPLNYVKRTASSGNAPLGSTAKKLKIMTHGQRTLAKANTKGMKALTSFFAKKT